MLLSSLSESNCGPNSNQLLNTQNVEQLLASECGFKFATLVSESMYGQMHDFGTYSQHSCTICTRRNTASDVISGVAVGELRLDSRIKYGDSTSNRCRVMRLAHFVMDDNKRITESPGVLLKKCRFYGKN